MKGKIAIAAAAAILLAAFVFVYAAAEEEIAVQVNGKWIELDAAPVIENERALIPLRGVLEELGASVEWDAEEQAVEVEANGLTILLVIGQDTAAVSRDADDQPLAERVQMDVPARIIGNRTFVPSRFIAETLGAAVTWDEIGRAVIIQTDVKEAAYEVIQPQTIEGNEALYSWYDEKLKEEGFHFMEDSGEMYILIAAGERPTGGYSVSVGRVYYKTPGSVFVEAGIVSPAPDEMVTQAVTYPAVLIKLERGDIQEVSGGFYMEGLDNEPAAGGIGESMEEMGKAIDPDACGEHHNNRDGGPIPANAYQLRQ